MLLARVSYFLGFLFLGIYHPKITDYSLHDWFGFLAVLSVFGHYFIRLKFPLLNRYILLSGGFLILGALATITSTPNATDTILVAIFMVYTLVFWLSLGSIVLSEVEYLRSAFIALGISVFVTSIYAIGQGTLGLPFLGGNYFGGRATGLMGQPNALGPFCATVLPYLLCLSVTCRDEKGKLIWIGVGVLASLSVLLSGSMTGAGALIAGILTYYALATRRERLHITTFVLVCVLVTTGFTLIYSGPHTQLVYQRIERLITSEEGRVTAVQRLEGNRNAWKAIQHNPVQGYGYHEKVQSVTVDTYVHNIFLRFWYNGGIFTLIAILILLLGSVIILFNTWRKTKKLKDVRYRSYTAAIVSGFVASLVTMQTGPVLYQRSIWFTVALAFAINDIVRRKVRVSVTY